jgi:membrane protease YdiL (CAAX protease family)
MMVEAGFLAPFTEEIVFRKTLKDAIGKYKWLFMVLSFLLFGGAHVIGNATSWVDYLYIIPYGSLGAAFALSYYKTDTIFTPMSMHIVHNLILTIISIVGLG